MSAKLCINLFSGIEPEVLEIRSFEAETWSTEIERKLISRIQQLLDIIKVEGKSLKITVSIETANIRETAFLVNKKMNTESPDAVQKLSIRELEVLGLIMQGFTNNEIAEKLFISYETVKSHRKNILEKTGTKNTAALISYYHQTFFDK